MRPRSFSAIPTLAAGMILLSAQAGRAQEPAAEEKPAETPPPAATEAAPGAPAEAPAPAPADPAPAPVDPAPAPVDPAAVDPAAPAADPGVLPTDGDVLTPIPGIAPVPMVPVPTGAARRSQPITLSPAGAPLPLRGVTLVPDKRVRIGDSPAFDTSPVDGVNFLAGLSDPPAKEELAQAIAAEYLNKPLTFGGLEDLVKLIERHYIKHGRQLTHVFVPSQLVTDKILVAVLEGKVTKLDARKAEPVNTTWWAGWYNNPYSLDTIVAEVKEETSNLTAVEPSDLNRVLVELNQSPWARLERPVQHPFRRVSARYSPVDDLIGQTEVTLMVEQRRPLRFFTGYDNALTDLLEEDRFYAGFVWYDAFALNLNHQLAFQYFFTPDGDSLTGFAANYMIPWNDKHTTEFYGAYSDSVAGITIGGIPSDVTGESTVLGFRHFYELPPLVGGGEIVRGEGLGRDPDGNPAWFTLGKRDRQTFGIFHEIGAGLDYKSTDNNLQFGGATVTADTADLLQLVVEYNARQTDPDGETNLGWKNFIGIGGSNETELNALRKGAEENYWYTRVELDREQDLPWGMFARGRVLGQYSTSNLLQSEQLGIGGFNSVRGYPERVFRGDNGWLLNLELYSPGIHPIAHLAPGWGLNDELRFLVFLDWGGGTASTEFAADPLDDEQTIGSVGIGLRYDVNDNVRLRLDWAVQLETLPSPPFPADTDDNRIHAGLVWTF